MFDHEDVDLPMAPGGGDSQLPRPRPLTFDPNPYFKYLADCDLTDAQKHEVLEALWSVMLGFVDMGFGISPIQQAMDKSQKQKPALASGFSDVVKSKNNRKINRKRKLRPANRPGVER